MFLQAYNATDPTTHFYTRGASGNWYFPWQFPIRCKPSLMEDMYGNICKELLLYLKEIGAVRSKQRNYSDSSYGSDDSQLGGESRRLCGA